MSNNIEKILIKLVRIIILAPGFIFSRKEKIYEAHENTGWPGRNNQADSQVPKSHVGAPDDKKR
ncbi:hypothetical protein MESS4_830027 [Mesorhizobium sp. STM 4661]|nr:hypothetical protein MESS4_830027 [Mesorhizobium sp. STM 4661]